jgi:rubrerythrin
MHGEAFAHARYLTFAQRARAQGSANLANLFQHIATVELREHFAAEASLAGIVGTDHSNLNSAIAGETDEANVLYPNAARQAYAVSERLFIANLFMRTANQEARHATHFAAALTGSCQCPCSYSTCPWQS